MDHQPALVVHVVSRPTGLSKRTRLITFTLVNRLQSETRAPRNTECFFQCGFRVRSVDGQRCFLSYPERPEGEADPEEVSLRLLHLHRKTFAVGHGCAAEWDEPLQDRVALVRTEVLPVHEVKPVMHTEVEGLKLSMVDLAHGDLGRVLRLCDRLADAYAEWIGKTELEIADRVDLTQELKSAAARHLENCRRCLGRMRNGIGLIRQNSEVASAFRLMNEAMLMQQIHYDLSSNRIRPWVNRSGRLELESCFRPPTYNDPEREWRPFQLAFILMNLESIADPHSPRSRDC